MNKKQQQWLTDRLHYLRGLKSPNEQQGLLILLSEKTDRTTQEEKTLSLLVNAERSAVKAHDHALYQSAGLLIMAGLVDSQTGKPTDNAAALLGALISLNELPRNNPKSVEGKTKGEGLLTQKQSKFGSGSPVSLSMAL